MSKLLLTCDQTVISCNGNYYAKDKERLEFFSRYLRVFHSIRLAVRCINVGIVTNSMFLLDNSRIEVVPIPYFSGPIQYTKQYFKIGKYIKNVTKECDVAIIRIPSTIGQRIAHAVMREKIPYAVEVVYHAGDGASNSKSFIERLLWKHINKDMKIISYSASGVSCVTNSFLQHHYYSKLPNAFVSNYSSLALDKSFYTSPKKHPGSKNMNIVHVSNQVDFNTRKGHIQIVNILKLLREKNFHPKVTFVGADYHNGITKLKKLCSSLGVEKQVEFTGRVDRIKLSEILESSDLFVFPTAAEGLPRVVIEAMAKGLPCIVSNVSGNPELISADMLVDYKDVVSMAEKIERLTYDSDLYEKISIDNFIRSKNYEASILEKRRDEFYLKLNALVTK